MSFKCWYNEDNHDTYNFPDEAMEEAYNAGRKDAAYRCKIIAQQHYLAENQAVEIDEKIKKEFDV